MPFSRTFYICLARNSQVENSTVESKQLTNRAIHSRGQHLCKFMGTKEIFYIRKEINSHRICLEHHHGRRFIALEHQYGRREVMWIRFMGEWVIFNRNGICQTFFPLVNLCYATNPFRRNKSSARLRRSLGRCAEFWSLLRSPLRTYEGSTSSKFDYISLQAGKIIRYHMVESKASQTHFVST